MRWMPRDSGTFSWLRPCPNIHIETTFPSYRVLLRTVSTNRSILTL